MRVRKGEREERDPTSCQTWFVERPYIESDTVCRETWSEALSDAVIAT